MAIKILSDIVTVVSEHIANPSTSEYDIFVGLEHYDAGEPVITRYGSTAQLESSVKHFNEGDILVARRNVYLKRAGVVKFEGVTSGDSIVLRVKDERYKAIIPFLLNTEEFWDYAEQNSDGTMSKRLAPDVLLEYECDIPDNHKEIADKLWAAYELKEAYKKMIAATDEMVKSQFIEMFGDPVKNDKILGQKNLSALGMLERGVSKFRPRNAPELLDGPYPLVQTGDVANCDIYITNYNSTYSEIGLRQSKLWPSGTLCITIAANIAKTGILTFDACFPDSIVGFIPDKDVDILYIHFWFKMIQQHIENLAPSTAQKNINLSVLSNLKVICPPISDQKKFSKILEQADKSKFVGFKSQFIEMFQGEFPTEKWEDCLSITNGKKYDGDYQESGSYPICGSGGIMGYGEQILCPKNTVILGRKGNINSPIFMESDYWIVDTAFCLDVDGQKLQPKYFYYWCKLFDFTQYNKQGVLPSLTKNDLLRIEMPIPPMNLQNKFVDILNQADKSKYIN